jgi:hypothetical protein
MDTRPATAMVAECSSSVSPHFKELMLGQILPNLESRVVEQYDVAPDRDDGQS